MNIALGNSVLPRVLAAQVLLLGLAVVPHIQQLSPWLVGFFFILATLRLMAINHPERLPGTIPLFCLTLIGIATLILQTTHINKEIGVGLLVVMLGLKLMELRQQRDIYVTALIGYFMIITQFLYDQSMLLTTSMILVTFGLTTVLIEINHIRPKGHTYLSLRKALIMLGQAMPIMLVLFILFPRLSGPLWQLGLDHKTAITGFSDSISLGSISRVSQSKAVAFRVDFAGPVPAPAKRYWRGLVLWNTDGYNWTIDNAQTELPATYYTKGEPVEYEVTLEPNNQQWLFSLDIPVDTPPDSRLLPDFQIQANKPITQRMRYKQRSYLEYSSKEISRVKRQKGLKLPPNITPRMRKLVDHWQSTATTKFDIIGLALRHFNREEFIYTLSPPPLGNNPADAFMFDTRRGFCEHYATSFVLLMRLADIPARVVVGYQGGEINPHGGYLIVRQSDAHAWAEVWLEGRGWVRIDPTAAVAPERIERPIDFAELGEGAPIRFQVIDPGPLTNLIKQFGFGMDLVNATWHRWVLGYTNQRQMQMLSLLGLDFLSGTTLGIAMIVISGLVILIITIGILRTGRTATDPVLRSYQQFCRKLAKQELAKRDNEGPRDYAQRIIRKRPELKASVDRIIRLYIGLRYGRIDSEHNRKHLRRLVRGFAP